MHFAAVFVRYHIIPSKATKSVCPTKRVEVCKANPPLGLAHPRRYRNHITSQQGPCKNAMLVSNYSTKNGYMTNTQHQL